MRTRRQESEPGRGALRSLGVRNYRLYCMGQLASLCGTWMQSVALAWLVLDLTNSGTQVGLVTAAQFAPVLVLGSAAAVLISVAGVGLCFIINALSFLGIIIALAAIRPGELHHRPRIVRARGQLREGIAYVARTPSVRPLFISAAMIALFGQNVNVVL